MEAKGEEGNSKSKTGPGRRNLDHDRAKPN